MFKFFKYFNFYINIIIVIFFLFLKGKEIQKSFEYDDILVLLDVSYVCIFL